jgi:hypothetical protein
MSDGPFKNSKLPKWWKGFGEAVHNDAVDDEERCARASHAVIKDVLTEDTQAVIVALQAFAALQQLEIDPASTIERIFDNHQKGPFVDRLQRELAFQLNQKKPPKEALSQAMAEALRDQVSQVKNRFQEECIHLAEAGDMNREQSEVGVERANKIFDRLVVDDIRDAVFTGNKNAFKNAVPKKEGLDEGPGL